MLQSDDELEHRRLRFELDQQITAINSELIGTVTGTVTKLAFSNVVKMVACLRARYLHTVLKLGQECNGDCISTEAALELSRLRQAYNEALEGFNALEHAVKRGYLHLAD